MSRRITSRQAQPRTAIGQLTIEDALTWIMAISNELDDATNAAAEAEEKAMRAENKYDVAYARSFMSISGAMEIRKHQSVINTEQEKFDSDLARVQARAAMQVVRKLMTQLEAARSLNAGLTRQFVAEATGQQT